VPAPGIRPAGARLAELASLASKGLIADTECEQRCQAIIQSVQIGALKPTLLRGVAQFG
jgi:hypothetical protein